jgi:hypothetical protein
MWEISLQVIFGRHRCMDWLLYALFSLVQPHSTYKTPTQGMHWYSMQIGPTHREEHFQKYFLVSSSGQALSEIQPVPSLGQQHCQQHCHFILGTSTVRNTASFIHGTSTVRNTVIHPWDKYCQQHTSWFQLWDDYCQKYFMFSLGRTLSEILLVFMLGANTVRNTSCFLP